MLQQRGAGGACLALWLVALSVMLLPVAPQEEGPAYVFSDTSATYATAQAHCAALSTETTTYTLAAYQDPEGRKQIDQFCLGMACWLAGGSNPGQTPTCPLVFVNSYGDTNAMVPCDTFQKFVCSRAQTVSPTPAPASSPSPRPSPSPSPSLPLPPPMAHLASPTTQASTQPPRATSPSNSPQSPHGSAQPPRALISSPTPPPPVAFNASTLQSQYELLPELSMLVAVHLAAVPGTDKFLYMERPSGYHPDHSRSIAGTFDIPTLTWQHIESPDGLFCCGHTLMSNGSVAVVGGHRENAGWPSGMHSIRTFTNGQPSLYKATSMRYARWYPSITLLPDSQILIMGGTQGVGAGTTPNPYYEIWDPREPSTTRQLQVQPLFLREVRQVYYPMNYVMPTGDLFTYCNRVGWILDPYNADYKVRVPNRPNSEVSPSSVYSTQYPFTASSVMLTLRPEDDYAVEVMLFGGAEVQATRNLSLPACSESLRLRITYTPDAAAGNSSGSGSSPVAAPSFNYSFGGGWEQERMGWPRVMPDATLLPNGIVILLNGASTGLAGDSADGGQSRANEPTFYAEMYVPDASPGARWFSLERSQIARMYHSTAVLTTNGTILVAGCDRCAKMRSNLPFSAPRAKAEYRNEIFYPPFWYDMDNKPRILTAASNVTYGQRFNVTYTGENNPNVTVTSAVFVAPSSTTHSFNMNQRVVKLVITQSDPVLKTLELVAPPSANHAPPQLYMLFLLNGYTYSTAHWVMLAL